MAICWAGEIAGKAMSKAAAIFIDLLLQCPKSIMRVGFGTGRISKPVPKRWHMVLTRQGRSRCKGCLAELESLTPALIVGRASRPAAGVHARLFRCEERVLEDPRTVENPAQPVGEQAGLGTRRRRGRPPHMVFITVRGPQAHPDRPPLDSVYRLLTDSNRGAPGERRVRISRMGGWPKNRLYSLLNWLALSYPTSKAALAASRPSMSMRPRAACNRTCF